MRIIVILYINIFFNFVFFIINFYFLFSLLINWRIEHFNFFSIFQPFDTRDLNIYNKKECKVLYEEVKNSVEDGLQVWCIGCQFQIRIMSFSYNSFFLSSLMCKALLHVLKIHWCNTFYSIKLIYLLNYIWLYSSDLTYPHYFVIFMLYPDIASFPWIWSL